MSPCQVGLVMPTSDVSEFLDQLERSRLISESDFAAIQEEIGLVRDVVQVEPLGRKLVRRGLLTHWQLQMLFSGREAFTLGNYRLLDLLGRGGMGTVLKAEHVFLGRIVAIKVMARRMVNSPKHIARFQQEIRAAAALSSPHVVRAIDAESAGSSHFLVMEYVEGADLGSVVERRGRLPVGEACEYVRQSALGLADAHREGLVHRDLKPANLMLSWTEEDQPLVKLLDLGLARFASLSEQEGSLTKTGQMMGTPDYMSPEQAWDTKTVDIRGDIYSLGCTLYRFLVGVPPFQGENAFQTLMIRTKHDAPPLRSFASELPGSLEVVVAKMLCRDPAERFQDPAEVVEALHEFAVVPERFEVERAGAAEPMSTLTISDSSEQATQVAGASLEQFLADLQPEARETPVARSRRGPPRPGPRSKRRSRRVLAWSGLAAVVTLLVLAVVFASGRFRQVEPEGIIPPPFKTGQGTEVQRFAWSLIEHPEQTLEEETEWEYAVAKIDHPQWKRLQRPSVELRLKPGGPEGVTLDPGGGLRWTPDERDGPGRFRLQVQAREGRQTTWHDIAVVPVRVVEVDRPPRLVAFQEQTIEELARLSVQAKVHDPDLPANHFEFSFVGAVPKGMTIDSRTGTVQWTPTESQGPGTFRALVRVTAFDDARPNSSRQSDEATIQVKVLEVDRPPKIRPIRPLTMTVGQKLQLRVRADDPDEPAGEIRFSLQGVVPPGASIDPRSGVFLWAPVATQSRKNWQIRVRAASANAADVFDETMIQLRVRPSRVVHRGEPLPDQAARAKAAKEVHDVYRPLLAQARTPAQRSAQALTILTRARQTDDAATSHALYELAHQTALKARDAAVAVDCVAVWRRRFQVDVVVLTLESLKVMRLGDYDLATRDEISERALQAVVPAVNSGRTREADQLLDYAMAAVKNDRGESRRISATIGLLKQVRAENQAETGKPLKLSPKGRVALGAMDKSLKQLRFSLLFVDAAKLSYVRHAVDDLDDLGRSLWTIAGGDVRLESPVRNGATGFWDKSRVVEKFILRARLAATTTTGVLLIGGPPSGGFDGLQLDLRPDRFCRLFHRGTGKVIASPVTSPLRRSTGWDRLELRVNGQQIQVRLNGRLLVDTITAGNLKGFLGIDAPLRLNQPMARLLMARVRVRSEDSTDP